MKPSTWVLGVAAVVVLGLVTYNSLGTEGIGSRGVPEGRPLPPFAVPLATSRLVADANVAVRPGSGALGDRPACEVRGPEILNVCELAERGPVVLGFLAARSEACLASVDLLDRVARGTPGLQAAVVAVRGDRDRLREDVRSRGWTLPVGYDADGAVANRYAVAICPLLTFALPGGIVTGTAFGAVSEADLRARVAGLVAEARSRGWEG